MEIGLRLLKGECIDGLANIQNLQLLGEKRGFQLLFSISSTLNFSSGFFFD